ncbi:MAG: FG-GAP-like repeat-containing protein [bacterium]
MVLFLLCLTLRVAHAQERRIGLANYDVVSGESVDYLKKVIRESLQASLKEKGPVTIVEIAQSEEEIKKKGVAKILKSEKVEALVTGSVVKVGAPLQINTRIYGPTGSEEPALISTTAESLDKLLPVLKTHSQAITDQLNRMGSGTSLVASTPAPSVPEKKIEAKKQAPAPAPVPVVTPPIQEKPVQGKVIQEEKKEVEVKKTEKKGKKETQTTEVKEVVKETVMGTPDYRWMSERLPYEGRGMAYSDVNGDGRKDVIVIDLHGVNVYDFDKNQLKLISHFEGKIDDHYVRVYAMDSDGDGKSEIYVANIRTVAASSLGLKFDSGVLKPRSKFALTVKVLERQGKPTLIGEPYYGTEVNYHKIRTLKLNGDKLEEDGVLDFPSGVGIYGLKEFKAASGDSAGLIYLTPSGSLKIYDNEQGHYKKRWSSSDNYGGSSNWINQKVKNFFNETEDAKTYINLDPVSWVDGSGQGEVAVAKNDNFLKNVVGTRPIVKNAWLTKLKWDQLGLREVWTTRKIDGYIADYERVQFPWEKNPQLMVLMWLRDPGFASAMGTFKSVVMIYDLN